MSSERVPRENTSVAVLSASPEAIWRILTDPTRTGEWSHECQGGRWVNGATQASIGAVMECTNDIRGMQWTRQAEVVELDAPRRYVYRTLGDQDSTTWTFTLEPVEGGTKLTQHFELTRVLPEFEAWVLENVPEHHDRHDALDSDLDRLGRLAAAEA